MDNYGQDYFMSQEGYASTLDFTLLDRPSNTISSAPESTAALLPDTPFPSFDFLDGSGVDAFGGVLREADEAHSREHGFRSDIQKYKKDQRSLAQSSVPLHRGDGDPDSELQAADFHMPFESHKPMDFFSQSHEKESANGDQQAQSPGNENSDGHQDYFDHAQISHQETGSAGGNGSWYNSWSSNTSQEDQTQAFLHTYNNEGADERRLLQVKGGTSHTAAQLSYHGSQQGPGSDPTPKATHAFLPTAKQSDSRQTGSMSLGLPAAQMSSSSSSVVKSMARSQPFDYQGMMNGASVAQFRQGSLGGVESAATRRHLAGELNAREQESLRSQVPNQGLKFGGQNVSNVEASSLKVGDYDFLGSHQFIHKAQGTGEIAQQLAVDDMQSWHQQSLLAQSNHQQHGHTSYQQSYQDVARQDLSRQHHQQVEQHSQSSRQQQLQQFLAISNQNPNLGNPLSAFLSESSLQDIPRVVQSDRQNPQMIVENSRSLLQQTNYQTMNNINNLNWSGNESSAIQGLAHDYLMGADQNFNWQALALKASQVDQPMYGSVAVNRRDSTGQTLNSYAGMQDGLQEYYSGGGKLPTATAPVGKPVPRSGGAGSSVFGSDFSSDVYNAANLQASTQSKHQALGKMPFWQSPYQQSVDQNRTAMNLSQANVQPRNPQVSSNSQARPQTSWTGQSNQPENLQTGNFASAIPPSSHQASGNSRQARSQQASEGSQFLQQLGSQSTSGSQFPNVLGNKLQSGWSRNSLPGVTQTGSSAETSRNNEGLPKSGWNSLSMQQSGSESQQLLKQPNIWSEHNTQHNRPVASSLHLFTDVDGRRGSMSSSHEVQHGGAQSSGPQPTKFDINQQSISPASMQVNDAQNSLVDLDGRQSGWRDHLLLQGAAHSSNSLQGYSDGEKMASWRNIWQNPPAAVASAQRIGFDTRQQSSGWGNSLQPSTIQGSDSQAATLQSRDRNNWTAHEVQQGTPQTNQLLTRLDNQSSSSHFGNSSDGRLHGGQPTLREEALRSKVPAEVESRIKAGSNPYSLQSQVAMAETDARSKAGHTVYGLHSQAGGADSDGRLQGGQKLYPMQSQVSLTETDGRQKSSYAFPSHIGVLENDGRPKALKNAYTTTSSLGVSENDLRQKIGHSGYSLQTQIGSTELDPRQASGQGSYGLRISETDPRLKGGSGGYNVHTHGVPVDVDSRNKGSTNQYNLQFQVGTVDSDLQHHSGDQNIYAVQSGTSEADVTIRGSQSTYGHQVQSVPKEQDAPQSGSHSAYSGRGQTIAPEPDGRKHGGSSNYGGQESVVNFPQSSSFDGRQTRASETSWQGQTSHALHGGPQTGNPMYDFSGGSKNQSAVNSLQQTHSNTWTAAESSMESWQKSGLGGGNSQRSAVTQVEGLDPSQQIGSSSRLGNFQKENQLQNTAPLRASNRFGRNNGASADNSMAGAVSARSNPSAAADWKSQNGTGNSTSLVGTDLLPSWSSGPIRNDGELVRQEANSSHAPESSPAWSRGQSTRGRREPEVHAIGSVGGNEKVPAWSRSQMSLRDEGTIGGVDALGGTSEVHSGWSRGQNPAVREHVEPLNLGVESTKASTETLSAWSRGLNTNCHRELDSSSLQDGPGGSAETWSRDQILSGRQEAELYSSRSEINSDKTLVGSSWSNAEEAADKNTIEGGFGSERPATTPGPQGKNISGVRRDVEKGSHEEVTFLDAGTGRETTSLPPPVPSPDRVLFSGGQKSTAKISPLSRSTLDLLSKPEELDVSSSIYEEEQVAEDMEHEDSGGLNASSISLAHLRRNQTSGPLSPQGFGLRLAPPSHLTQNAQSGNSTRVLSSPYTQGLDGVNPSPSLTQNQLQVPGTQVKGDSLRIPDPGGAGPPAQSTFATTSSSTGLHESPFHQDKVKEGDDGKAGPGPSVENVEQPALSRCLTGTVDSGQAVMGGSQSDETGHIGPVATDESTLEGTSTRSSGEKIIVNASSDAAQAHNESHLASGVPGQSTSSWAGAEPRSADGASFSKLFSTFRDSLSEQGKQIFGQLPHQHFNVGAEHTNVEKGMTTKVEVLRQSQGHGNVLNGLRSGQWHTDVGSMTNSMKAEVMKRLIAAQGQNKTSQPALVPTKMNQVQFGNGSASTQIPSTGQEFPGHRVPNSQVSSVQEHHQGAADKSKAADQSHGVATKDSTGNNLYTHSMGLSRQCLSSDLPEKHVENVEASDRLKDGSVVRTHFSNSYSGQMSSEHILASNKSAESVQPGMFYGETASTLAVSTSNLNKHSTAILRESLAQAPATRIESEQRIGQERGLQVQTPPLSSEVPSSLVEAQPPARVDNHSLESVFAHAKFQQGNVPTPQIPYVESSPSRKHLGSTLGSGSRELEENSSGVNKVTADIGKVDNPNENLDVQESVTRTNTGKFGSLPENQSTVVSQHDGQMGSSHQQLRQDNLSSHYSQGSGLDGRTGELQNGSRVDNQGSQEQYPLSQGNQSGLQQLIGRQQAQSHAQHFGLRQDNHGAVLQQQWQAHSAIEPTPLTDYQFQRLLEAQPAILATLNQVKSDPRVYQIALAQLRAYFNEQHIKRQLVQYQQQESGMMGAMQKSHVSNMSTAAKAGRLASHTQIASQTPQIQGNATQVQAAQSAQPQFAQAGQRSQTHMAGQVVQAVETVQGQQAAQAAIINKNASTAARLHYLSQIAQRGPNANGLAHWYPGAASLTSNSTAFSNMRTGDMKGLQQLAGMGSERSGLDQPGINRYYQNSALVPPPSKKRKKEYPPYIPWRDVISQAAGYVSTSSGAELEWATATNRIPDKDPYEEYVDSSDTRAVVLTRAKRRLRFTTHLMQQIIPPVAGIQMASKSVEDRVGSTYTLAKLSMGEACRIASIARRIKEVAAARDAEESRIEKEREQALKDQERTGEIQVGVSLPLTVRIKRLEVNLQRLDTTPSAVELMKEMHEVDRLGVVNRLAAHQTSYFSFSDSTYSRHAPRRHVSRVVPSQLPEGLMCLSL